MGQDSKASRALERLCGLRADRFGGSRSLAPAHVLLIARIAKALLAAPLIHLKPAEGAEGDAIRRWIDRRSLGIRTVVHRAMSVLRVERRTDPLHAPRLATLRRMDRKAAIRGILCRTIDSPLERERILEQAIAFEKAHPDERYRRTQPNIRGLKGVGLWIGAFSREGRPLVLAVIPVSGNVALLRYFRTVEQGADATLARYALTAELVRHLARRRVRYLVDNQSPIAVGSTLRHFATMVGFTICRADIR